MLKDILRDNNLSLKAKGLYCILYNHIATKGEMFKKEDIRKEYLKEGKDSFNNTINELKDKGYLTTIRHHAEGGRGFKYSYILKGLNDTELQEQE